MGKYKNNYINANIKFDKTLTGAVLSALWVLAGVYGFIYEVIFYYFNGGCEYVYWRGGCFGPWILIYSIGALLMYFTVLKLKKKPLLVFILSGLECGLIEGLVGAAFYYLCDGKRNWDYNTEILNFGNIGGFVCLRSVLVFAVSGVILVYILIPFLYFCAKKMKRKVFTVLSYLLFAINIIDLIYNTVLCNIFPQLYGAVEFYSSLGLHFMD